MFTRRLMQLSGSLAAGSARVVQMATTFALIPFLVKSLGTQGFATYIAASSLVSAVMFLDFGIGSSLVNKIAGTGGQLSQSERRSVTNAILVLSVIASVLALAIVTAYFGIYASNQHRVGVDFDREKALFLTCLSLALMPPLLLVPRLRLALSEVAIHSLWEMTASILIFVTIWTVIHRNQPLIPSVLSFCFIPYPILILNGLSLFRRHPVLIPAIRLIDLAEMKWLVRSGISFFLLAALSAACFSFDSVLAVYLLDGTSAAEFGLAQRLALGMQTLITLSLAPFWPRFHAALEEGDRSRAISVLQTAFGLAVCCALLVSTLILFFGEYAAKIWTRGTIALSPAVCAGLAAWLPIFALAAVMGALMNIPMLVKIQLRLMFACTITCVVGKIVFAHLWGPSGLFWGNIAGFSLAMIMPGAIILSRHLFVTKARTVSSMGISCYEA